MIPTTPAGLATWLATARSALIVDAYTVISVTGTVVRWIDADFDFTLPAPDLRAFARGPQFARGQLKQSVGLSVDNLSLTIYPVFKNQPVQFGAQTLLQAAQRGTLRGATLLLERLVFANDLTDYQGSWNEFSGTLAVKSTAGGVIKAEVLAEINLLDQPMPRDVFQPQCKNTVFDAQCGLSRAAWQVSATVSVVATGSAAQAQFTTALAQAAAYFDQGVVQFTTGANAGEKRTVKAFAGGVFAFALPWPQAIAVGDQLVVVPGCSRSLSACTTKFANRLRFRGEPFIPQPETVN